MSNTILPPGIRSSRRVQPPAELLAPAAPPYQPGERVWLKWGELDADIKLHHSGKRTRSGRVVKCLIGVQFEDEVEPMWLPPGQLARACAVE